MAAISDFRLANLIEWIWEMSHATFGVCITICTIHPKNARYLLHCNSVTVTTYPKDNVTTYPKDNVTTYPKANVTTCPNVISLAKCVIVDKYGVH